MSSNSTSSVRIASISGGSIQTNLDYGIVLNKDSTLQRKWITVHDEQFLIDFSNPAGISVVYEKATDYAAGGFKFRSNYTVVVRESISAFEVIFLLFDVWGNSTQTLSADEILDLESSSSREFEAEWNIFSENDASAFYASIAYVSKVRKKSGLVFKKDPAPILLEARKFSDKFSEADLDVRKAK